MSPTARTLLLWLREKAGEARCLTVSIKGLTERTGLPRSSVTRGLRRLRAEGFIELKGERVGIEAANTYAITSKGVSLDLTETGVRRGGETPLRQGVGTPKSTTSLEARSPSFSETKSDDDDSNDVRLGCLTPEAVRQGSETPPGTPPSETRVVLAFDPATLTVLSSLAAALTTRPKEALCLTPIPSPSAAVGTPDPLTSSGSTSAARTTTQTAPAPASGLSGAPVATTPASPTTHEARVLAAATDGLATGESPPDAWRLGKKWGLDVLERAVSVTGWTEARKELDKHACATIQYYLDADKIPGLVPLTFRQLVRDLAAARLVAPPWLAPHLEGLEPAPKSEAQADRERAKAKEAAWSASAPAPKRPTPASDVSSVASSSGGRGAVSVSAGTERAATTPSAALPSSRTGSAPAGRPTTGTDGGTTGTVGAGRSCSENVPPKRPSRGEESSGPVLMAGVVAGLNLRRATC